MTFVTISQSIEKMLELKPNPTAANSRASVPAESKQPRRLMLALVLLLVALAGVIVKDRQFWFGSEDSALDAEEPVATHTVAKSVPAKAKQTTVPAKKSVLAGKTAPSSLPIESKPEDAPAVATTRTVLPPLDVEVIAGDTHRNVHPGSNAAKLEITRPPAPTPAPATNAAERESVQAESAEPTKSYPLLAQQMKVQGSVVLQALVGADGVIENLHVLSGPSILASAAQQAVREWRFKPILQNGQAVESKAKITVNFTIKIADGSEKITLAETQPLRIETLSR